MVVQVAPYSVNRLSRPNRTVGHSSATMLNETLSHSKRDSAISIAFSDRVVEPPIKPISGRNRKGMSPDTCVLGCGPKLFTVRFC